ncbi:hypothetical protein [uncultured Methanolobus sp.]|nr:hypothetical protein [uncultured Methanolobus sp.]
MVDSVSEVPRGLFSGVDPVPVIVFSGIGAECVKALGNMMTVCFF